MHQEGSTVRLKIGPFGAFYNHFPPNSLISTKHRFEQTREQIGSKKKKNKGKKHILYAKIVLYRFV